MYLKRLEMLGFKSFATRTQLEFSPGITAVVGPNGAGKSNVADAMRWVLGEQSMRQLRGKRSDDIIFAGAQGRAPLGMAEVSLTLDNSTGWVPSEYSEITVTRRSFRSGENEYLINKQKVRLKDVLLLLAQARIGHDSYTVVGQGLIDAALSLRAEERRGLFEDAAGIRPFQVQRVDAENRLKQTEQNVERLRDIVSEIEPRLVPLQEQAQRAIEIGQLNSELQALLLAWYALQWRRLAAGKERSEHAEQEQSQLVQKRVEALHDVQEQVTSLHIHHQQTQVHMSDARKASNVANERVQRSERDIAVNEERVLSFNRQCEDMRQEERRLRERSIMLQKQLIDLEEQCDLADEAVDGEAAKLAGLEGQVARIQKEYELDQRRLRGAQNDLVQMQARLGSTQTELGRLQKQLGERNRTLAARRDAIAQAQQSQRTLESRLLDERGKIATVRGEEQQLLQRKQAVARSIADSHQEMERLKSTLAEAERQKRTVVDRLNMLKSWRQNLSGYNDGVRTLLRAPAGKLTGLLGPVPQLGVVPEGMELALEAALGLSMQAVVVQSLPDALRCLDYLEHAKAGKAMVIWLEREGEDEDSREVNAIQRQVEESVLQRFLETSSELKERVPGFAWQHVQCEPRLVPLFSMLLRGIVIAKDLEVAHTLLAWAFKLSIASASDLPLTSIVTLQGEVLHVDGWLSGGSGKEAARQGLLAHERELRDLPQSLEKLNDTLNHVNTLISELQRQQEGRRSEQAVLEKDLQKIANRISELNRSVNGLQRDLERVQTEIQLAASLEQQLAAEMAGLEQEVGAVQERIHAHEKSQHEMTGLVEELQIEVEERAVAYRRQQDELGRTRTALAVKRQEAKSLRQQVTNQRTLAQDLKAQVERQVGRIKEVEQRHHMLTNELRQQNEELERARVHAQSAANEVQQVEEELTGIDQRVSALERQRRTLQQAANEQESSYRRSLLASQKACDAVEALLIQLQEELGIADPDELSMHFVPLDNEPSSRSERDVPKDDINRNNDSTGDTNALEALSDEEETRLRRYRKRIDLLRSQLKSLGSCDMNAPQLYEETKTRYDFLSSQITDMDQAALQLRTIIGQLDVSMAQQFEITFQAVNARFREHFTTLFKGGMARLELISASSDDSLALPASMPAGIEVIVQPPGKKVQDLSLLSGGERALVSAALLFALLEINPPPFCLLDEVDAALDESNVTRFCDILKRLAQRTQFIVITHNRVTMTAAQVIYGVSMRESVSRLLSLRLEEVAISGDR